MKAITVRQPYAWAILSAGKDVENRSWRTHYRGPLLIHAGSGYERDPWLPRGIVAPSKADLPFGAILGIVDLVDVVERSRSRWFVGEYGFVLRRPRLLSSPIYCPGRLSLWTPTPRQIRQVLARVS